ncbi:MAG: hypothetical protein HN348_18240, partial [Proteobacteria bacterium]|nr:hypothetical protein [Pseudomonadota bacterium]
ELLCRSCHELVGGSTKALLRDPESLCLECHADQASLLQNPHHKVQDEHGITCLACHEVHGEAASGDGGCLNCHDGVARGGIKKGVGHPWQSLDQTLSGCQSCHDAHLADSRECGDCHQLNSLGHSQMDCRQCHPAHGEAPSIAADVNPASAACVACHSPNSSWSGAPRVGDYEHPAPVFLPGGQRWQPLGVMGLYDRDGRLVEPGKNGDLTCLTCHRVHSVDGEGQDLRQTGWKEACSACHGTDALFFYLYFHQPQRRAE